ncbi:MAG: NAD(P)H-dependent oxidoreductase [Chloroflexaceae bacterium]|nr:NAD(P)H-dependent oxidoreductase [Chloroflexaceae bacterium]
MTDIIRMLGISGSLRAGSYNTALLRAATELLPEGMTLDIYNLAPIPLYNEDIRAQGDPASVQEFRTRIADADALVIATPEYNYSIPGVLKNAIDWASRPPTPPLPGKPVAIMGASPGGFGTVRSQMHLKYLCADLNMYPLNRPNVLVSHCQEKFDPAGRLVDEETSEMIRKMLVALAGWVRRLQTTPDE